MSAGDYVAAAYATLFVFVLAYVLLIVLKLGRIEREIDELERRDGGD